MNEGFANSVGELLRTARESKKLSLDDAHRETKISVATLASLEQDDFEAIGSDIYLKGFLKSYARFLGMDVDDVLKTLDRQRGKGAIGVGTMWDIEESVTEEKIKSPRIFRRVILPLLILIILVMTILFFRERRKVKSLTDSDLRGYLKSETVERLV